MLLPLPPSVRCLASILLAFFSLASNLRLVLILHEKMSILRSTVDISRTLQWEENATTTTTASLEDEFISISTTPIAWPNEHTLQILSQCNTQKDNITSHIQLQTTILNVSVPSLDQYFNPSVIPLPSHSRHEYLLISRLVTPGLHQESHVCFAKLCLPDSHKCTAQDFENLPNGGLMCTTPPEPVNIPPTPARRCTGNWAAFPDIPGFHDPRIFWGNGQPLIEINSGSQYGCIGLWIQDLRNVWPNLDQVLTRKMTSDDNMGEVQGKEWNLLGVPMHYKFLTEITRNPRRSRNEIEKNWVLFFPGNEESWVQYDMIGKVASRMLELRTAPDSSLIGLSNEPSSQLNDTSTVRGSIQFSHSAVNSSHAFVSNVTTRSQRREQMSIIGGRTIAQMIAPGYTTLNLTSPFEQSCFTEQDLTDSTGAEGHWHQGSNSLRLIMCTRDQIRHRTCLQADAEDVDDYISELTSAGLVVHFSIVHRKFSGQFAPLRYERYILVWEARKPFRILGVSRYPILFDRERARPWPLMQDDVKSQQKRREGHEEHGEIGRYFTYTPSIAWVWRPRSEDESDHRRRGHEDLGTGFLGDLVLISIGVDDVAQGVVKVKVDDLLRCLRLCPGVS